MAKPFQPPQPPLLGREYPPGEESQYIGIMIQDLEGQLKKIYPSGETLRQAHPKMHGCVRAEFIIESGLPEELRIGLFKETKTFPSWIRFSNASTKPKSDGKKDVRGMAIKLMDVPGEKLLSDQKNAQTHDFNLISHEVFVSKNVKQFQGLMKAVTSGNLNVIGYFMNPFHWGVLLRTIQSFIKCDHVLSICYWSTTPYQFGEENCAVKYHVSPHLTQGITYKASKNPDYLKENLVKSLSEEDAYFDFCVQFQKDAIHMPIEDPTVKWNSAYIKLATIRIPVQEFDTDEQNEFGTALSFTPWHCLPEHRPIGGLNRARKQIYQSLSKFRHERNHEPFKEPTFSDLKPKPMNPSNEQLIKALFADYAKGDMAAVMAMMDPAIQWIEPGYPDVPFGGTYTGIKGISEMFGKQAQMLKIVSFAPKAFFSNDTMVIVLGSDSAEVISTKKVYSTDWTMAFTLSNGKITNVETYMDTNAIAKAFVKDLQDTVLTV
jgi:ketosteroid isomerase-like protein